MSAKRTKIIFRTVKAAGKIKTVLRGNGLREKRVRRGEEEKEKTEGGRKRREQNIISAVVF